MVLMERIHILCLFGIHKKKEMPWLMEKRNRKPGPKKACTRCGKCWYDYIFFIGSPERSLFSYSNQQYEGQRPPKDYGSWDEYYTARRRGIDELLERMRNDRRLPRR